MFVHMSDWRNSCTFMFCLAKTLISFSFALTRSVRGCVQEGNWTNRSKNSHYKICDLWNCFFKKFISIMSFVLLLKMCEVVLENNWCVSEAETLFGITFAWKMYLATGSIFWNAMQSWLNIKWKKTNSSSILLQSPSEHNFWDIHQLVLYPLNHLVTFVKKIKKQTNKRKTQLVQQTCGSWVDKEFPRGSHCTWW